MDAKDVVIFVLLFLTILCIVALANPTTVCIRGNKTQGLSVSYENETYWLVKQVQPKE